MPAFHATAARLNCAAARNVRTAAPIPIHLARRSWPCAGFSQGQVVRHLAIVADAGERFGQQRHSGLVLLQADQERPAARFNSRLSGNFAKPPGRLPARQQLSVQLLLLSQAA